jgi:hypothetical protein
MSGWTPARNLLALTLPLLVACATPGKRQPEGGPYAVRLPLAGGGRLDFAAFRGRVLLVDFFTTWNRASQISIPGYSALYRKYHRRGLSIVGVALDELGAGIVKPFVDGMDIPYPVVLADTRTKRGESPFGDLSINPLLMLFDDGGRLKKVFVGHVPIGEIDEAIEALLR